MKRVVVVGGGISGLALAYRLEQGAPDADVTLLERRPRVGGTIGTDSRDGFRVERGPNGFLDNNPATVGLSREIGLEGRLVSGSESARKNRFLLLRGKLRPLPSSLLSFLSSDLLSGRAKLALLTERFRKRRREESDESVEHFARRRTSEEVAATLVDAFVTGIHAADPGLLSVRAAFPRLARLEREHGSVMKGMAADARQKRREARARGEPPRQGMRMWSFAEGLQVLPDTLAGRLRRPPVIGVAVRRVERTANGWVVVGEGTGRWPADVVALACPAHQQAVLLADLDPALADEVSGIPYNRVAVVALGYRRADVSHPLDGFGYLSPGRDRRDVLGVQWCSSIYAGRAPSGHVLLRAMCGGWHRPEMVGWDDERLLSAVRDELKVSLGVTSAPVFHEIVRWDRAIPQYHVGHLERVARIEKRRQAHPGLFLGGNSYRGVSLNDCVEQGGLMATAILKNV
jgi:oxygen-dependent protoporphyrinogen oxidase